MRFGLALLSLSLATPAAAINPIGNVICAPSPEMQERLAVRHGSERIATGLRNPEEVVEVWTGNNGEWAMVIRYSSGTSCIVAIGEYWQQITVEDRS